MKLVEVSWLDAGCEHSSMPLEGVIRLVPMPRSNVGYLVYSGKDKVIISFGKIEDSNIDHVAYEDNLVIPKSMVLNIREVK
ncbi:hypothetical protein LCGC14_2023640 [marine sediment metagenome]|uniref:Uncharacterized protein n=1 Tax=marine sediment metagenome TaxID=412755 RepID=A0A0F9FJ85_9ZZZZ